jgi:hypothetical protein
MIYTTAKLSSWLLTEINYAKIVKVEVEKKGLRNHAAIVMAEVLRSNYVKLVLAWFNRFRVLVLLVEAAGK